MEMQIVGEQSTLFGWVSNGKGLANEKAVCQHESRVEQTGVPFFSAKTLRTGKKKGLKLGFV